jgi:hypothetical protein
MQRWLTVLLGPEFLWICTYAVACWLARQNLPPTELGSQRLERLTLLVPCVAVVLSFVWFFLLRTSRWGALTRLLLSGAAGVCVVTLTMTQGVNYRDSRNSGLLALWILALIASAGLLLLGTLALGMALVLGYRKGN